MWRAGDSVDITIPEWLADNEGFDTCHLEGTVRLAKGKAVLIELVDGTEVWLPTSVLP